MLPERRVEGDVFAIPKFILVKGDVEGFKEQLRGFHGEFADYFKRSELREHFFQYMAGQLSSLERKTIEPIAERVEGGNVRQMQWFIGEAGWDEVRMLPKDHSLVADDLGDGRGVLILDDDTR